MGEVIAMSTYRKVSRYHAVPMECCICGETWTTDHLATCTCTRPTIWREVR